MSKYLIYLDQVIDAYNATDFDRLSNLLADDLDFSHATHNISFSNNKELIDLLKRFASEFVPGRKFLPADRVIVNDNIVVREGRWVGRARVDLPGIAERGREFSIKLCSVMRFSEEGTLLEWKDYG